MKYFIVFVAVLLHVGCAHGPKSTYDNVVLITLDTTRADALGAYGNSRIRTPTIDALAAQGQLFEQCYTHAPITLPSHSSILSGKIPTQHGVRNNISYAFPSDGRTLGHFLGEQGFETGAFVSSIILDGKFGLNKGFDVYEDKIVHYSKNRQKNSIVTRRAEQTVDKALAWIEGRKGRFFSWIHLYDAHWPYDPPLPYRQAYAEKPYFGEIAYMDLQLNRVVQSLKARGLYDRTLIVVTADHGESFSEHGEQTHGFFCYGATTHVPLILSQPLYGEPGTRYSHLVQSIDLAPSIMAALGLAVPEGLDGTSLADTRTREVFSEAIIPHEDFYLSPVHGLRDGKFSFYYSSEMELYDLSKDPAERENLAEAQPDKAARYEKKMKALLAAAQDAAETTNLDQESIELLRSLGYIADGGAFSLKDSDPYRYRSPKQSVRTYRELQHLRQFEDQFPYKTIAGLEKLLENDRRQVVLYRDLGRLQTLAGNEEAALDNLKKAAILKPDDARLHTFYGLGLHRFGRYKESVEEYRLALKLAPGNTAAHYNLGLSLAALDRPDEAIASFEAALSHNPSDVMALNNIAYLYFSAKGDAATALTYINKAADLKPDHQLVAANKAEIEAALAEATP